jgi:hypothetical protein
MPAKATWLLDVPEILKELAEMKAPFLDRTAVERLFGVRRRRAIQLMSGFGGGYLVGKTFLISRRQLIASLEAVARGEEFFLESRRRERLVHDLEKTRKEIRGRRVKVQAPAEAREMGVGDLPAGIHLRPGELRIEFFGTEDLLRHLFELSQAIINDYPRFQGLIEE